VKTLGQLRVQYRYADDDYNATVYYHNQLKIKSVELQVLWDRCKLKKIEYMLFIANCHMHYVH